MIDENKIEEAALRYCEVTEANEKETALLVEGFEEGARWAEKEFVKSLWHDGREIPEKTEVCIIEATFENDRGSCFCDYTASTHTPIGWTNDYFSNGDALCAVHRWCYISDILPKEEK